MASQVSPPPAVSHHLPAGVAPLRAGQGRSFLWRRLHSITGIVPVGAFLFEHILFSNAVAINGPAAYAAQVKLLGSLPLVVALEAFGIWIPILYHGLYGFYIWYRGDANVKEYPWQGNWLYTAQRWTGGLVFFYICWHVYNLRFAGIDLHAAPAASFGKVQGELMVGWQLAFYIVALVCASWHFAYGIWLFCAKWGITVGELARRRLLLVCVLLFLTLSGVGLASIVTFRRTPLQPTDVQTEQVPAPDTR